MAKLEQYLSLKNKIPVRMNHWDVIALFLFLSIIITLASATKQMSAPFHLGDMPPISLDPSYLPSYALQTVLRMAIAFIFSLLFTFIFATWAAKSPRMEKIIIPLIDILQSVPVLAFLSITIVWFIALFPGSLWGPQCASIFLIFTAQAWNMALSFYQSLKTVPSDFKEAADMLHLSAWQRFWRIEVPFSIPSLLWNSMMSMSASWFSLVYSEAVSVSGEKINLPGIGSYIATAILQANVHAVIYAIIAMFLMIIVYDQILFRPLIQWSEKFNIQQTGSERATNSWLILLLQRTLILRYLGKLFEAFSDRLINLRIFRQQQIFVDYELSPSTTRCLEALWNIALLVIFISSLYRLTHFLLEQVTPAEIRHVFFLGLITGIRVFTLIILCSFIWVPFGVWVGLKPKLGKVIQPIAQFLAAFPANLLYPLVVIAILKWHLNVEIWTAPLMVLGTQWYILFNVIAGASAIPKDLRQVADNFGISGWLWWRRLILPGIFPYYITGAITAVGGAWNASLVAEVINWGDITFRATGIGAYIVEYTGNFAHTVLGVAVMSLIVLLLNHVLWRPLYVFAQTRFQFD